MKKQKLLVLYLSGSSPDSNVIGWSIYDGTTNDNYINQEVNEPPYKSGIDAMRDGWRVIKFPEMALMLDGSRTYGLGFDFILERY